MQYRYGELQGWDKQEISKRYGKEQVHEWRRSYDIPPPEGESLEMCSQRAVGYFKEHVSTLKSCFDYFNDSHKARRNCRLNHSCNLGSMLWLQPMPIR